MEMRSLFAFVASLWRVLEQRQQLDPQQQQQQQHRSMAPRQHYLVLALALCGLAAARASGAPQLERMIEEESARCATGDDSMACLKVRAMRFLDTVITHEHFKVADVEVRSNGARLPAASKGRSGDGSGDFYDLVDRYIRSHDVSLELPVPLSGPAKVTLSARNLADDELNLSVKFADAADDSGVVEGKGKKGNLFKKGKKHRLRKMAMPIMVLILLKAMTIIPMAIGILKIKALNALALGFLSFIVSLAADHHPAHITAHGPWDGRAIEQPLRHPDAQPLAYQAYA